MFYNVSYEIEIDADSPLLAALEVERIMKSIASFRPVLTVTDESGAVKTIDLDKMDSSSYINVCGPDGIWRRLPPPFSYFCADGIWRRELPLGKSSAGPLGVSSAGPKWFVRRKSDNTILCIDGIWRNNAGYVENIKFFKREWNAKKYGLKNENGTAFAIYPGDTLDCLGCINGKNTISNWPRG
jgi:hypothetical protein